MDKKHIDLETKFNDLAECTEYFYDEIGKLDSVKSETNQFTRRELKILHRFIVFFFFSSLNGLKSRMKSVYKVDKTAVKEFNKEFKNTHKPSVFKNLLSNLHKNKPSVELITEETEQLLTDIFSSAEESQQDLLEF